MYSVIYSVDAQKDLNHLNEQLARRIIKKIAFYAQQKDIKPFSKALEGFKHRYRFRIGEYRAVFKIDSSGGIQILMILRIKNRKDIYEL